MEGKRPFAVVISAQPPPDRSSRPLSINEAFQYTPLTTSPLHASDFIPLPSLSSYHGQTHLVSRVERKAITRIQFASGVQRQLQALLKPHDLAEIKFKRMPDPPAQQPSSTKLSPLAKTILDSAHIDYRYPSAQDATSRANAHAHSTNGVTPKPIPLSTPPQSSQVSIDISPPADFRREEYAVVPESPKRRKLNNDARDAEASLRLRTQKEQGDTAVLHLQELLSAVIETQTRLDSGLDPTNALNDTPYFEIPDADEDFEPHLSPATLDRLQSSLKQLVSLKRLKHVPKKDLERLQRLCQGSIETSSRLNLRLSNPPSDDDLSTWLRRLKRAESGAASASTFLYTCLGSEDHDLQAAPDTIRAVPSLLVNIFESVLQPVVEARPEGQHAELFRHAAENEDQLKKLLECSKKLLDVLTSACVQVQSARDCVSETEFVASSMIFAQNASSDKSAALGIQTYERVRKQAMSSLARIFAAFPEERSTILDSILTSVDKLPSTSRSARQYKLADGKSIMLISALFMQLVQTAALESSRHRLKRQPVKSTRKKNRNINSDDEHDEHDEVMQEVGAEIEDVNSINDDEISQLQRRADILFNPAATNASDIVHYLVTKASKVSKTGDSPYRNVLDLLVEDLVNLLCLPEWPAAELLLRLLANKMVDLATNEKAAGIKNMALESLGVMGSAISESRASTQKLSADLARDTESGDRVVAAILMKLTQDQFAAGLQSRDLIGPEGPFALTCRYYEMKGSQSLRAKSARSFHLAQYAKMVSLTWKPDINRDDDLALRSLAINLLDQIAETASDAENIGAQGLIGVREAHLAYLLGILNLAFCRKYEAIVKTLLSSLSSDQAQVRSRSLKSVVTMLETDPSLLDRDLSIPDVVFRCASDDSAMVRDAAIAVIAKFIITKPALEEKGIKRLLECAGDAKVGVQKRAITHLSEIYGQDCRPKLRAAIAQTFLRRTADFEESVNELAKKTLSDVWVSPHLPLMREPPDSAKSSVAMEALSAHIVETLNHDSLGLALLLTAWVKALLKTTKNSTNFVGLIDRIVEVLFQSIISGNATPTSLVALMAFAEARPESVAPQHLTHLRRYLGFVSAEDDLPMFKSVIAIFRHVLPRLSVSHQSMLRDIQNDLMSSINKLGRRVELDEVMSCLRTIDGVLHNSMRFVKLLSSVVTQICKPDLPDRLKLRLVRIAGSIGKYIDLDALSVNGQLPEFTGSSVSGYLTEVIFKNALRCQNEALQLVALESLGAICQSWPSQFNKQKIAGLFCYTLDPTDPANGLLDKTKAQIVVLKMFDELFSAMTISKDETRQETNGAVTTDVQDLKKMGGSAKAQDDNSAIASMANSIKTTLVKVALSEQGERALLAVRILASIAERGMFHPKDYAGAFIALETSQDWEIREVAIKAHKLAHQHHESHFEREYMQAVQQAFAYQKSISDSPMHISGVWQGNAKLGPCFEIVNTSGSKYVKKFLSNLVTRLSTDYSKLDVSKSIPDHVLYVRFVAQNVAHFEYARLDDLLHVILQLELLFSKNGPEVSQAIELAGIKLEHTPPPLTPEASIEANGVSADSSGLALAPLQSSDSARAATATDTVLLKRLAAAACAVTIISETRAHLKKQYGVSRDVKAYMLQQKQSKESTKAPSKTHGITGDKLILMTNTILSSLSTEADAISRCRQFHELMSVDEDIVVDGELDEQHESHSAGPEMDGVESTGRSRKRKTGPGSAGGTPKKPRGRPRKSGADGARRSASASSQEDPDADYFG